MADPPSFELSGKTALALAMRIFSGLAAALLLAACAGPPATEADRQDLIGVWNPTDRSDHTIEFKSDGVFDYHYAEGTVLRLDWTLTSRGRVTLTPGGGATAYCVYEVSGDSLTIDDGSGRTCVRPGVTPPVPMPMEFKRAS